MWGHYFCHDCPCFLLTILPITEYLFLWKRLIKSFFFSDLWSLDPSICSVWCLYSYGCHLFNSLHIQFGGNQYWQVMAVIKGVMVIHIHSIFGHYFCQGCQIVKRDWFCLFQIPGCFSPNEILSGTTKQWPWKSKQKSICSEILEKVRFGWPLKISTDLKTGFLQIDKPPLRVVLNNEILFVPIQKGLLCFCGGQCWMEQIKVLWWSQENWNWKWPYLLQFPVD